MQLKKNGKNQNQGRSNESIYHLLELKMIVYKAINLINNKPYIGQTTTSIEQRKAEHLRRSSNGSRGYFHSAIRKHGKDNFKWEVLMTCPNLYSLNEAEVFFIKYYDSMDNGYNLTSGGLNCTVSEETRIKIGNFHRNKVVSQETRDKISKAKLGRKCSEATKKKISISRLGAKLSEEHKKKIGDFNRGKIVSEETRKKISLAHKLRRRNKL